MEGTWIDVGAHHGEVTCGYAKHNPGLRIYAFEPNIRAAARLMGHAPNYVVIPMAVTENNGCSEFFINAFEASSSLLHLDQNAVKSWVRGELLREESRVTVPTIRLDTFMEMMGIAKVDFLKVDAQGADLAVIKSAGDRIRDITKIVVEVSITPAPVYVNSPSKEEVVTFLENTGFSLVNVERQSCDQEENLTFTRS
jgi:FkbM family methyltransferase